MFRKIARPMLASVYIADGVDQAIHPDKHPEEGAAVVKTVKTVVPPQYSAFIPSDAVTVNRGLGGVKVAAGTLLALGKAQRLSAAALALTALPALVTRHAFWTASPENKENARNGFLTQTALLGGLLITVSDTQGKPGVIWRGKHAAKVANKKVQQALPGKSETEQFLEDSKDKANELAGNAKGIAAASAATASAAATDFWDDKGKDLFETAASKAQRFFDEATDVAQDYVAQGKKTASKLYDQAQDYYEQAADYVDDNKDDWLKFVDSNAKAAKDRTVKAAKQAQERADKAAQELEKGVNAYSKKAVKASAKAQKEAAKTRKKAVKRLEKKFNF